MRLRLLYVPLPVRGVGYRRCVGYTIVLKYVVVCRWGAAMAFPLGCGALRLRTSSHTLPRPPHQLPLLREAAGGEQTGTHGEANSAQATMWLVVTNRNHTAEA